MTIHKEGYIILSVALTAVLAIGITVHFLVDNIIARLLILSVLIAFFLLLLQFFRKPSRVPALDDEVVLCPADGKVVVIEKTQENEYFQTERIQVSIFMSPTNIHINWSPISGVVKYFQYFSGKFLVAWHPKSSIENERTTMVFQHKNGKEVLLRQIAGALARRICWYVKVGEEVKQGEEIGFIKFGSRIDLFLPLDSEILVDMNQKVKGKITPIAR
ncbi:MAG: phosphatidylserine decarboxylase family protein, partial [Bacteroidetes bacterium]